ncbi:MAG TPA: exodeoxyribonuclease V subunit gamma, partial [Polyangiales bacterium]|nr:exodeoxyribonuclease V subunit gamma [Polyangiales bacterium]
RVFDDYGVYRPELLRAWQAGDGGTADGLHHEIAVGDFEPALFAALVRKHGHGHLAARAERCIVALRSGRYAPEKLPQRLCLFGLSSLPPLYLEILQALAQYVETHLFLLSPSRAFFADIGRHKPLEPLEPPASGLASGDGGHPLIAALGRIGRELQDLLEQDPQYQESDRDLYVDPGKECLLHALQSDMLALENRGAPGAEPRLPIADDDDSIAIQICHGPMREVEVLHDQLVAMLEDERLAPHQIVVMAPDIEGYAPVIEAVFGAHSGRPAIPFSVADRRTRSTHAVIAALFALFETLRGRMAAGAVLDLLGLDCIRERFGIAVEELGRVREWVEESGVRWGVDAEHRAQEGQPAFAHNTWRFGLDRLLLGLALSGRDHALYQGTAPLDDVEGSDGELLGKLSALCERLFAEQRALSAPRKLDAWQRDVERLLAELIADQPETAQERESIRSALTALCADAEQAGFTGDVDVRSLLAALEQRLDSGLPARGLLARGVTFCQLVPMRSIPFEVVCLLGMNDGAFPRPSTPLSFDRMAEHGKRRAGDRSIRDDDRYMFLEAVLCARKRLLISYVGRGIHDNRVRPPSVVVGDLLDAITQGFEPPGLPAGSSAAARRAAVVERLCVEQRLQAFSPRYFERDQPRLFSYAANAARAAQALLGAQREPAPPPEVRVAGEPVREISLDELVRFVGAPVRAFAQRRLGLFLGDELAPPPAREPVELDALEKWQLKEELLRAGLRGRTLSELLPALRASGVLPLGSVGSVAYRKLCSAIEPLAQKALAERHGDALPALPVALELGGVRLHGALGELWPSARIEASASRPGRRFELVSFVHHLVLCTQLARTPLPGYPAQTVLLSSNAPGDVEIIRFAAPGEPEPLLRALLALYEAGQRAPLPFEYLVSRQYAECLHAGKSEDEALERAASKFNEQLTREAMVKPDAYVLAFYPRFQDLLNARGVPSFVEI